MHSDPRSAGQPTGAANAGPGQILITGNTYDRVKHAVQVRELGLLRVAGKHEGVLAYDVIGWRGGSAPREARELSSATAAALFSKIL